MDKDQPPKIEKRSAVDTLHQTVARQARDLIAACAKQGIFIEVVSGYRSYQEQRRLYEQGRTTSGKIVTNSKPGHSWHNFRLAFDVAFREGVKLHWNGPYRKVATIAKALGLEWGGDWKSFKDFPHFQNRMGMTLSEARQAWEREREHERQVAKKMSKMMRDGK